MTVLRDKNTQKFATILNRQPTVKKGHFLPSTVKTLQGSQISLFQLIFTDFLLLNNLLTGKTNFHVLKNTFFRNCKTLQLAHL